MGYVNLDEFIYIIIRDILHEDFEKDSTRLLDKSGFLTIASVTDHLVKNCETPESEAIHWAAAYVAEPDNQYLLPLYQETLTNPFVCIL